MLLLRVAIAFSLLALAACSSSNTEGPGVGILGAVAPYLTSGHPEANGSQMVSGTGYDRRRGYTEFGSDTAIAAGSPSGERVLISDDGAKVTLNFVNADVQEFVRVVFDEVLKESVVVDPNLTGRVTVRTTDPVSKTTALALIRNVLQLNGASLTQNSGVYRVSGRGAGPARGQIGENIRITPLKFLNAEQARAALQPFAGTSTTITADPDGRYLVLSGTPDDLDSLRQVLDTLDIDQMQGMSFALLPLKEAGAGPVSTELTQMFSQGSVKGFRALPIQRMNAVLVISRTPQALARARNWVQRLDQSGHDTRSVHVYPVQNRRAVEIAKVLDGMFGARASAAGQKTDGSITPPAFAPVAAQGGPFVPVPAGMAGAAGPGGDAISEEQPGAETASGLAASIEGGAINIRADTATNSLVIVAKPEDYRIVEAAIRRLDVLPSQVLIEATIVEVGLNDALRHGVRWYFEQGNHSVSLTDDPSGSLGQVFPGFNYVFNVPQGRVVLNALERVTDVEVVSSPALTVLDNQTATLKIGDQVPIATRAARGVTTPDAPVVNDIEMKDTGMILSVTPRVNASGLVMLDISQEASDVVQTTSSSIDSPTIRQRKVNSSVAVQSGAEVILGGIMSTRREKSSEGVPLLKDIPLLGAAFTSKAVKEKGRTELVIIIRPTVMGSRLDVENVTQEIKARMLGVSNALYGR